MGKVRIAVKKPGCDLEIIEVEQGYRTDTAKKFMDNAQWVEYVMLTRDGLLTFGVDEDGKPKGLETNFYISTNHFPAERIVGTAVFTRVREETGTDEIWDYEIEDLTEADIASIRQTLDPARQIKLSGLYDGEHIVFHPIKFL